MSELSTEARSNQSALEARSGVHNRENPGEIAIASRYVCGRLQEAPSKRSKPEGRREVGGWCGLLVWLPEVES